VTERLPRLLLRLEGAAVFAAAIALYLDGEHRVLWLVVLFLVPDLSIAAYAAGAAVGAAAYNLLHTSLWPLALGTAGVLADRNGLVGLALIWLAHVGGDRMLGFGLKYPTAFADTHLQRV
jgi:hypothetical protein